MNLLKINEDSDNKYCIVKCLLTPYKQQFFILVKTLYLIRKKRSKGEWMILTKEVYLGGNKSFHFLFFFPKYLKSPWIIYIYVTKNICQFSENSLDMNNVEYAKRNHDNDNPIEEKEVIMDLYGEDEQFPTGMNDEAVLLNQVLQQNAQTTPTVKNEGSQNEQQDGGTINESYEIVESTDV